MFSIKPLDGVALMLRAFARVEVPSKEEAYELIQRAQAGDVQCRNEMIERSMRLVVSIAVRYRGRGVDFEDLIQQAVFGLERAIKKFDLTRGLQFSTYATPWIKQVLGRYINKQRFLIWVPHLQQRAFRQMSQDHTMYYWLSVALKGFKSLDAPMPAGRRSRKVCRGETVPDRKQRSMDAWLDSKAVHAKLHDKLDRLDVRSQRILWLRACGMSLEAVASQEGVTRERIRQLQDVAMVKLAQEYGKMKPEKNLSNVLGSTRQPARRAPDARESAPDARPAPAHCD